MTYQLSKTSTATLANVHPRLIDVVQGAIKLTTVDFKVEEGVRSLATQRRNVASGASKTLNSMHLVQSDGHGHAVDLFAVVGGEVEWGEEHYYPIVLAMVQAARALGIRLRHGACWKFSDEIEPTIAGVKKSVADYMAAMKRLKRKPLLDFVHHELPL